MIIIKQSIENAISPVMNPMINMTTHLLMLIFSRSCVKKKKNNNRKDTVLLERPLNQTFSVVTFGQMVMCNFRDPSLVTFYFYELTHF